MFGQLPGNGLGQQRRKLESIWVSLRLTLALSLRAAIMSRSWW